MENKQRLLVAISTVVVAGALNGSGGGGHKHVHKPPPKHGKQLAGKKQVK